MIHTVVTFLQNKVMEGAALLLTENPNPELYERSVP